MVGHSDLQKALQRLRTQSFVEPDRQLARVFVSSGAACERNKTAALHPDDLILYSGCVFVPCSSSLFSPVRKMALTAEHKGAHQTAQLPCADSYIDHGRDEPLTVMCAHLLRAQAFVSYHDNARHYELYIVLSGCLGMAPPVPSPHPTLGGRPRGMLGPKYAWPDAV